MKTITQLITEILSDNQWHSSKEVVKYCLGRSDKDRQAIKVSLHNMVARNSVKRARLNEDDADVKYRMAEVQGFGVSEKLALLDQHLRKAREGHATT
ncbi:hypothetical protein [Pantoea sp.]|uniref:hypothetical protein n=1 Tax=Pantoea sp. TaxID=69393 RepID=UPI0028B06E96|nr:hypothetical protein [Pantoea sp.]